MYQHTTQILIWRECCRPVGTRSLIFYIVIAFRHNLSVLPRMSDTPFPENLARPNKIKRFTEELNCTNRQGSSTVLFTAGNSTAIQEKTADPLPSQVLCGWQSGNESLLVVYNQDYTDNRMLDHNATNSRSGSSERVTSISRFKFIPVSTNIGVIVGKKTLFYLFSSTRLLIERFFLLYT